MLLDELTAYFDLKAQAEEIKKQMTEIRASIQSQLPGNSTKTLVHTEDGLVTLQTRSRLNRKCKWDAFAVANPELYNQVVTESETTYFTISKKQH